MNLFLDIVRRSDVLGNESHHEHIDHNHNINYYAAPIINGSHFINNNQISFEIQNNFLGHRETVIVSVARTRVYIENVWADPLPDLSGRFRNCTAAFYRENPAQTHRLQRFIIRDVAAIRSVDTDLMDMITPEGIITNMVLQSILNYDIIHEYTTNLLIPYLGEHTAHFCHELYNFANSPYDIVGYDRNVRYSSRSGYSTLIQSEFNESADVLRPASVSLTVGVPTLMNENDETIVLDSDEDTHVDNNSPFLGETIVLSSASEIDSEVEIIHSGIITHTIEDSDSSRDQPSTSTGIRNSLDRPNNRYNLRRRRRAPPLPSLPDYHTNNHVHIAPSYLPNRRGGRIVIDTSSEDEESRIISRPVHTKTEVIYGRRKRKIKKNKIRKRRRNIDIDEPELHLGRNRSFSESSSNSGDTDTTRLNNTNFVSLHTNVA